MNPMKQYKVKSLEKYGPFFYIAFLVKLENTIQILNTWI